MIAAGSALAAVAPAAVAQEFTESKVDISFNRYHAPDEVDAKLHELAAAYPELVELRSIGKSLEGRDMWMAIVNDASTGAHDAKPAMWIDGNIHANEIQGAEVVLYTLWYLCKEHGSNDDITELLSNYSFYLLPTLNPDSRAYWFREASTPHFPRANQRPVDSDRDGFVDEDPPDDLDGDGSITQMWAQEPGGRWKRDEKDPRIFSRVPSDEKGDWTYLGQEGIDNDGDGRINEDGPGGDDMNRNWPSDWKPNYVQYGAGPYPLSHPETNAVATWVYDHPNIAAFQTFHNSGGMMLRGPGASYAEKAYPRADQRVYDEIGNKGEKILPYYDYLVIYKDLYGVHGGESTWAGEGRGVISFTNEIWSVGKYFQRDNTSPSDEDMWLFRDRLQFGETFTPYTEFNHPKHGPVLIGGLNKWSSRSTPTFMLEEECHRNFAFTMYHADNMPVLEFTSVTAAPAGGNAVGGLWTVDVEIENSRAIPTRTGRQASRDIGTADLLTCTTAEGARVVASGARQNRQDDTISPERHEPARVLVEGGVGSRGTLLYRFYIEGVAGQTVNFSYESERAKTITAQITMGE
ncbi:MAG: hypothetical protein ACI89L_000012 [Phycisphaerales bacterium]|jgi:hypothetical protein